MEVFAPMSAGKSLSGNQTEQNNEISKTDDYGLCVTVHARIS
jgi:hypothetical protein